MSTGMSVAQKKQLSVRGKLRDVLEKGAAEFASVLPAHITPERMIRIAMTAATAQPKLLECSPQSVALALLAASQTGLEPDGYHAHLVPYKTTCQFIPDYKGLIQLALDSDVVIDAYAVHEKDEFEYELGTNAHIRHVPSEEDDRGDVRCAYAVATFPNGRTKFVVATKSDIEKRMKASSGSGHRDSPWQQWYPEMACKGLDVTTPIPTPSGWSTMGELVVGDEVFDADGLVSCVTDASEVKMIPCYRVEFSNDEIICDDEHRWVAKIGSGEWGVCSINEMYRAKEDGLAVVVPLNNPLELEEAALPVDPYLLGYWLGNGAVGTGRITCHEDDVEFLVNRINDSDYTLGAVRRDKRGSKGVCIGITEGFLLDLRDAGVADGKHIPQEFMRASIKQRRQLLCGLIDSDGHVDKARGRHVFSSTNATLADGVFELVASLGDVPRKRTFRARGFGVECVAHTVEWKPFQCCALLPRKAGRFQERAIAPYRPVVSIVKCRSVPTRCIAVDSPSKTYLAGRSMTPTHNTAVKMLSKYIPRSPRLQAALVHSDMADRGLQQSPRNVIAAGALNEPAAPSKTSALADTYAQGIRDHSAAPAFDMESFQKALAMCQSETEAQACFDSHVVVLGEQVDPDDYERAYDLVRLKVREISPAEDH